MKIVKWIKQIKTNITAKKELDRFKKSRGRHTQKIPESKPRT